MKALILEEPNKLIFSDSPDPQIGEDEVLVQVKACGICGSDIHGMDGSTGRRIPPVIMGHEAGGIIVTVGRHIRRWKVGDRVTFDSTIWCGECWHCRRGDVNLCDNRRVLGVSCDEYRRDGAFAEYVTIPDRILVGIPQQVSFAEASMTEPLAVAFHGVRLVKPEIEESAIVIGTGTIGLLAVQVLRAAGCAPIIAVDIDKDRLSRAINLGADVGVDSREEDAILKIMEVTGRRGADLAVEAVGVSATVAFAVAAVRKGGRVSLIGNLAPNVELPFQTVVTRQISLLGSCASQGEYVSCLDLIARGRVNVNALISARAPLSEGAEWFGKLTTPGSNLLKVVLEP